MPIWLNKGNQKIPIIKPMQPIMIAELLKFRILGIKFISEFWVGI